MDQLEARLVGCFAAIFPDLDESAVRAATMENVNDWDSIATVTLINVIEEEFGIQIDPEDIEDFVSFRQVLGYVRDHKAVAQ